MANKSVFKKGLVIGIILLFIGASVVPSISGNVEEKNKTNIDIDPTLNEYIIKESFTNNNINNEKNERYRNTQPAIFNGGNSKGWSITGVVSTESTEDSWYPSLMVDSDGVVHVAWYDDTDYGGSGSDTDIFYNYKSGGNQPPNTPDIDGPTSGKAGTSYDYTFTSTDPDGDQVSYYIKWDDGSITDWTTFQASGPPGYSDSHVWDEQGTYTIEAKAKDTHGAESDWATLDVTMPRNKILQNSFFLKLLERFANAFPILRYIFNL